MTEIVHVICLPLITFFIIVIFFEFDHIKDRLDAIWRWIECQSYIKSGKERTIDGVQYEEFIRLNDGVKSLWPKRGEKL